MSSSVRAGVGDEFGRRGLVGEVVAGEVGKLQDFGHLDVIDFVGGVAGAVVIGVKAGEPPERWNVVQDKRELVAAEENVQR